MEPESFQHQLQRFEPGIVWLDAHNRVLATNALARRLLGGAIDEFIVRHVPARRAARPAAHDGSLAPSISPPDSAPPMTMIVNVPERVLLLQLSTLWGAEGCAGTCMLCYDVTEATTGPRAGGANGHGRALCKLPVYKNGKVVLLDLEEVVHLEAEGHYTNVYTERQSYLCNLSLSELESRLDLGRFVRVHRSHIVNVRFAAAFERIDDQCVLVMRADDAARIPISRSHVPKLKSMFGLA